MSDEFDIEIDPETDPPNEKPADFHERLVLTLKTTDPTTLKAAERDYRGVFRDVRAYLDAEIRKTLPPEFAWLLDCCATAPLLAVVAGLEPREFADGVRRRISPTEFAGVGG